MRKVLWYIWNDEVLKSEKSSKQKKSNVSRWQFLKGIDSQISGRDNQLPSPDVPKRIKNKTRPSSHWLWWNVGKKPHQCKRTYPGLCAPQIQKTGQIRRKEPPNINLTHACIIRGCKESSRRSLGIFRIQIA